MPNTIEYWRVDHSPDLTETGFFTKITYIKTIWVGFKLQQSHTKNIVEDYCYKTFGNKVVYVQGVAPTLNWKVTESTEHDFTIASSPNKGDHFKKTTPIILKIGDHGQIEFVPYAADPEYETYLKLKEKFDNNL